jgi:hypothetical protein
MTLSQRIDLLVKLGGYFDENNNEWQAIKEHASRENPWFVPEFIELAVKNIRTAFLEEEKLVNWAHHYGIQEHTDTNKLVGLVMAGNIPLVGFHDFLAVFISGHSQLIKASSKDEILIKHIVTKLSEWNPEIPSLISFSILLKNCTAYIATGSNNSSRYFDYYFGNYPHIIRRNRTSVAILDGNETAGKLDLLADDIQLYFGLGCRNVTKLYVPEQYDFIPLLAALKKYNYYLDFHKYNHNFDYQLAMLIMNGQYYMNSGAVILTEKPALFSPVSQVHFEYYTDKNEILTGLQQNPDVQCIVAKEHIAFGAAQSPALFDYADGVDTMQFLTGSWQK